LCSFTPHSSLSPRAGDRRAQRGGGRGQQFSRAVSPRGHLQDARQRVRRHHHHLDWMARVKQSTSRSYWTIGSTIIITVVAAEYVNLLEVMSCPLYVMLQRLSTPA